jgi:cytochrome c biogenesis protein CcmG/thiol:disulfide interchange protein DsbE
MSATSPTGDEAAGGVSTTASETGRSGGIRIAAIAVGVVIALLVVVFFTNTPGGGKASSPLVGKRAPELVGTDMDGKEFDLTRYRGSWVLVNFFASWCPPCKAEHPELVKFSEAHSSGDAQVVSVAFNDAPEDIEAFFAERGGDWPVLAEGTDPIVLNYGVVKLPESYLVAPDGTIVAKMIAGITADEVDGIIAEYTDGS